MRLVVERLTLISKLKNESMVCPCSGAYMRGEKGEESLMVCLLSNLM